jgi:glycosyltransferase involved in cell wall biosynthesis
MRVLHIIDTLWLGGAQTLERDYFEMQKDNHDLFLYVLRRSNPQITIQHENIFVHNSFSRFSFFPILELKKIIRDNKIGLLHCHLLRSQLFGYLVKIFFFPSIKLVIHEQGDVIDSTWLSVPIIKLLKYRTDLFMTCSNALKKSLQEKANIEPAKVYRLYNGIDLRKFNKQIISWNVAEERRKIGIEENVFVVGFAGRLIERKGWREFVEVAKKYANNASLKFLIAGEGVDRKELLTYISVNGLNDLIYIGYASNMQWFYSIIDCLVVPSHHEPMGMIIPEAQAMGVPVIAANVDGLNEIVVNGNNVLLFKAKDIVSIELALQRVINDKQLRDELIINGIINAEKYSIENYNKALDEIYSRLLKHKDQ